MERLSRCKSELLDILTGYDSLQKRLTRESDLDMAQNMANNMLQQVNQQDMQFLEGDCGRLLSDLKNGSFQTTPNQMAPPPGAPLSPAAAPDPQIQAAFDSGDYPRVITLYNQNWAGTGRQPAAATSLQYSRALLKNYQFEEAQNQLAALDAALGQQNDPLAAEVLRVLGDLAFGNGNYQAAQQYYGRLAHLPFSLETVEPIMGVKFWDPAIEIPTEDVSIRFEQGRRSRTVMIDTQPFVSSCGVPRR